MSWTAGALVERMGGHPAAAVGIDPEDAESAGRWFVLALLLTARGRPSAACDAYRALARDGLSRPGELADGDPARIERSLDASGLAKPAVVAQVLFRASSALVQRHGGSFAALAAEADDLNELGGRIAGLAPGVGHAAVTRFLRPLRAAWVAASDVPLAPAARAAAVCLGLLREGEDEDGGPGALRAALASEPGAPTLTDTEAALERLGGRSCLRGRPERCPLASDCPAVGHDVARGIPRE